MAVGQQDLSVRQLFKKVSQSGIPNRIAPRAGCPRITQQLYGEPRGHSLMLCPFSNYSGVVVICSQCGHYTAAGRRCKLHSGKRKGGESTSVYAWEGEAALSP